jgi:hypothetical protein
LSAVFQRDDHFLCDCFLFYPDHGEGISDVKNREVILARSAEYGPIGEDFIPSLQSLHERKQWPNRMINWQPKLRQAVLP